MGFEACAAESEKTFKENGGRTAKATIGDAKDFTFEKEMKEKQVSAVKDKMSSCIEKDTNFKNVLAKPGVTDAEISDAARKLENNVTMTLNLNLLNWEAMLKNLRKKKWKLK